MTNKLLLLKGLLSAAAVSSVAAQQRPTNVDYVIVGAGPAGFVLAEQLSRNAAVKVTLLEAGPSEGTNPLIYTPAFYPNTVDYMYNYSSQPDPNLGGLTPNLYQGKVSGGGTAVNAQLYCRGSASVFDEWATTSGNPALAWNSLLNDFKATTHYQPSPANYTQKVTTSGYGNGPLEISKTNALTGFDLPFADALKSQLSLPEIDMTDGTGIGVSLGLESIRVSNRTRSYALNAFGYPMANRPNVQVINNAAVTKIGFAGKKAKNVIYTNALTKKSYQINAKEIIVSGGAINSPKLLLLSGIGPKADLAKLKIPLVADIPQVGTNLVDHHYSVVQYEVTKDIMTVWQFTQNATEAAIAKAQYAKDGSGPLGWNNGDVFAGNRVPDSVFNGIQSKFYQSLPQDRPHVLYEFGTVPFIQNGPNVSMISAWSTLVQPEASGRVTLKSANAQDDPLIHSNYYGSAADKAVILYAYKKMLSIMRSDALKPYIVREVFPGPDVKTDDQLWKAIQQTASSFHHPIGSVALGTVLDSNWRIKGLKGIRVVDSSTIPNIPTCHTQSSVYAIAHRAALDIQRADGTGA